MYLKQKLSIILFLYWFFLIKCLYAQCDASLNNGIQKIIDEARATYKIPGIQVSVSCPLENFPRHFVSGTTTLNATIPLKSSHLFQIGSETKSFTAAILLKLEAEGLLSINDPITQWLPQFPAWKNITIKHLLNHTSGIFEYVETEEFLTIEISSHFQKQWLPDELITLVMNKPLYFEPGKGFHYSNSNYVLAGMIITAVTGRSLEEIMNTLLIVPSQLTHTYYLPRPYNNKVLKHIAHGYYFQDPNMPPLDATEYNMSAADAAGAVISTANDVALWIKQLLTTDLILPEKQRAEMMSLVDMENGQALPKESKKMGYGLGIERQLDAFGKEVWGHYGNTAGYVSNMAWLTSNQVFIALLINFKHENDPSPIILNNLINYIQQTTSSTSAVVPKKQVFFRVK